MYVFTWCWWHRHEEVSRSRTVLLLFWATYKHRQIWAVQKAETKGNIKSTKMYFFCSNILECSNKTVAKEEISFCQIWYLVKRIVSLSCWTPVWDRDQLFFFFSSFFCNLASRNFMQHFSMKKNKFHSELKRNSLGKFRTFFKI